MKTNKTKVCPYCGEVIGYNATACPHCGSDERTGWSGQTYLDGIDIGDEIDYDEIARNEFATPTPGHRRRLPLLFVVIAFLLVLLFVVMMMGQLLH